MRGCRSKKKNGSILVPLNIVSNFGSKTTSLAVLSNFVAYAQIHPLLHAKEIDFGNAKAFLSYG